MGASRLFNGSNYFTLGASTGGLLQSLANFTVCGWIYRAASGSHCSVFSVNNGTSQALWLGHYGADNKIYFETRSGSTTYANTGALTNTGFYHIAGVLQGGVDWFIYVNGVAQSLTKVGSPPATTSGSISTSEIVLGRLNYGVNVLSASGNAIGCGSFHNVALSANEITGVMKTPNIGRGIIGGWSFNGEATAVGSKSDTTWAGSYPAAIAGATMAPFGISPPIILGRNH